MGVPLRSRRPCPTRRSRDISLWSWRAKHAAVAERYRLPAKFDHNLPEMGAALQVTKCFMSFRKGKNLIYYRMNTVLFQRPIHFFKHFAAADINPIYGQS